MDNNEMTFNGISPKYYIHYNVKKGVFPELDVFSDYEDFVSKYDELLNGGACIYLIRKCFEVEFDINDRS
jgi:hypothetical protein